MRTPIANSADYLSRLGNVLKSLDAAQMDAGVDLIERTWRAAKQIITLGNGGSALMALHFIND